MSLFNKKNSSEPATQSGKSGKNKLSLLILLLLLAVFGYLYFFTSLIVPHEVPPPAAPAPTPQVKQAMPPKVADPAAPATGEVKPQPEAKPAAPAATAQPPAQKPAAAQPQPAAPNPAPPAPAKAESKPAPPAPAKAEPKPAPQAKKEEPKPSVKPEQKPASKAPEKTAKQVTAPDEGVSTKQAAAKAAKADLAGAAKKSEKGFYLDLGDFAPGAQVTSVEEKLDKLKIKPVTKVQSQKARQMHRLYHSTFNDYDAYFTGLEKLKEVTKGAFAIEKDGRYFIYAGSFSSAELAQKEKKRLLSLGIKVESQIAQLPLSLVNITAGGYSSRAEAEKAAARLAPKGLKAKVVQKKR